MLVGGTALALQLGHRTSTDIDLFSNTPFDVDELLIALKVDYKLTTRHQMRHAILVDIENVKTDFVFQPSDIIGKIIEDEKVRMASLKDIAAMKISAITARGKKEILSIYIV